MTYYEVKDSKIVEAKKRDISTLKDEKNVVDNSTVPGDIIYGTGGERLKSLWPSDWEIEHAAIEYDDTLSDAVSRKRHFKAGVAWLMERLSK